MKILHLIQCTNLGGMEQSMYNIMRGLQGRGYYFTVVALHPLGLGKKILDDIGVPAVGSPYRGKCGLLSHHLYRPQVKRHRPDLVLVTGPSVGNCWAASTFKYVPKILTVHYHHGKSAWDRFRWRCFYRLFSGVFDEIIYNSKFIYDEAMAIFPPLKEKSKNIGLPIAIPAYRDDKAYYEAKKNLGLPEESRVIGNAGWLIQRKRFDLVLQVAALVYSSQPNLIVLIAGSGEKEKALRVLAAELGIGHRVHWLGWQKDLTKFYQALDILLFNSEADSLPRTPMEAMAYGIPVVASSIYGGLNEILRHEENGFFIPSHDVPALAAYIELLLNDKELATKIGMAGRLDVIATRHPDVIIKSYKEIFDFLVREKVKSNRIR